MADAHVIAAADQERAHLRAQLRGVVDKVPTFSGTTENQDGTAFHLLRMMFPDYTDLALVATELVRMVIEAEKVQP